MPAPYPSKSEIELPLLRVIAERGGQAKPSEIYDVLAAHFGLLLEQRVAKSRTAPSRSQSKWENDVQGVRNHLVKNGELAPTGVSGFGIWRITLKGEARLSRDKDGSSKPRSANILLTRKLQDDYYPLKPPEAEMANILVEKGQKLPCMTAIGSMINGQNAIWKKSNFVRYQPEYGIMITRLVGSNEIVSNGISDQFVRFASDEYYHVILSLQEKETEERFKRLAQDDAAAKSVQPLLAMAGRTRNILLYGPPGTGKTWLVTQFAKAFTDANKAEMVTFHQSFAYEEFVEGIKPVIADHGQVAYDVQDGVFKRICRAAQANPSEQYLLIIDEINRANIAKVLGELITLIEDDKRLGEANAVETTLPYSGGKFGVPPNLTILGTMNTADRSIALLDLALRRRFTFVEMPPDPALLPQDVAGVNLQALLTRLNRRVAALLDPDHRIGHSYLMNVETEDDLHFAWYHRVLPLLQEYFYHDGERMQAVVGEAFVQEVPVDAETKKALGAAYDESAQYETVILTGEAFIVALQKIAGQ